MPTCSSACRHPTCSPRPTSRRWHRDAIVFALANPDPEIDPALARRHAKVVATGRSDFPNQINNVLAFPGVFRGLLDAQSRSVPRPPCSRRRRRSADVVTDDERHANYIVPSVFHPDLATHGRHSRQAGDRGRRRGGSRSAPGLPAAVQFLTRVP